ncbi:MAG: potassium-transporting ATPase subunit KdpA [Bacteriovoracaceae bacterium]
MQIEEYFYIIFFFIVLFSLAYPLGLFITRVFEGELPTRFIWLRPIENVIYRFCGINPNEKQTATAYFFSLFVFNILGLLVLFSILIFQGYLPLNPQGYSGLDPFLAFNTAISFMTNTNWQAYSGEVSMSYFSQMFGLTVQNFLSAATGGALVYVIATALRLKLSDHIGNFWVDMTRMTLYILLPLSFVIAIILVGQGVIQNFDSYAKFFTLEGTEQIIPMGPVASQVAIKQLGTNGGGFFGVNSAHPFENPTPFSNFLQLLSILLIPVAQVFAFGKMIKEEKQGFSILATMVVLFISLLTFSLWSENNIFPTFAEAIPLEGKEVRFSNTESVLWSVSTTAASNGSVNSMHSSLSPLSGLVTLFNMMTGEVIFGGVGAGFYGMFLFVILTVFIAGLMVGRSPEYLGKKIEVREVKLAMLGVLAPSALVLIGAGVGVVSEWALASRSAHGPHGLSEILYAFTSTAANNGSAFAGFNANTPILNLLLGICMFIGRFAVIYPVIMICGSLASKKTVPVTAGTFPTDSYLFSFLLLGVILIVGALTFFPALTLGPIAEHLLMLSGATF